MLGLRRRQEGDPKNARENESEDHNMGYRIRHMGILLPIPMLDSR
jgi:hypothetical protein